MFTRCGRPSNLPDRRLSLRLGRTANERPVGLHFPRTFCPMETDDKTAISYSDNALIGAIRSLERMTWRDAWGESRLAALKAEKQRRDAEGKEDA